MMNDSTVLAGRVLKQLREKRGFTQKMLADRVGISLRTVQAYEQGQRDFRLCPVVFFARFADCFAMTVEQLWFSIDSHSLYGWDDGCFDTNCYYD